MLQRGIIIAGAVVYLTVMAIVLSAGTKAVAPSHAVGGGGLGATTESSLEGLPFRGIGVQIQRVDWIPEYKKVIDKIADTGADTVLLVFDGRQENGKSSKIYLDYRMTPTTDQIGELIDHAKKRDLRVILMPRILLDNPIGGEWRGTIHPDSWDDWWASYREMMQVFSSIAEVRHADMLVVGSEMVSTEHMVEEWTKTIQLIRSNFKGKLTYSSNWDHYEAVTFWDQLDMVGMNAYWKMGKDRDVTVEEVEEKWKEIQSDLFPFLRKVHKPMMFLEVGWFSKSNSASEPWDYTLDKPIDLDLQKKLYEAFFRSWYGKPLLGGFSIWEWPPNSGGPEDGGYTPEGKPALDVLKEWLKKGRWEVK